MPATYSTHIDAPISKVFDFWRDPAAQLAVMPPNMTIDDVKVTSEGLGTYYSWTMRVLGVPVRGFDVYTEFVPNQRITDRSSFFLAGTWTSTFEAEGSGTRMTMERRPDPLWLTAFFDRLADPIRLMLARRMMAKVKAELEKPSTPVAVPAAG